MQNLTSIRSLEEHAAAREHPVEPQAQDLSHYTNPYGPQAFQPPTSGTAANGKPIFSWNRAATQLTRESDGWNGVTGEPLTITYAFRSTAPGVMPDDTSGFSRFSAAQIAAAEEALQRAILHRFKAAIIDVSMPIMSGQDLAQRLRLRDPRLPVMFISGYVHEPLRIDSVDRITAFLPKPFDMDALFVTLDRICKPAQPERTGRVIAMPGVQLDR